MDDMTPEQRKLNMQHIRSVNSKPEVVFRKELWKCGFRYRKNDKRIYGKPDLYLPKYKTVIFINGCFWHRHANCRKRLSVPATNIEYWTKKFQRNIERDKEVHEKLQNDGFKVIIIWECTINEAKKSGYSELAAKVADMIKTETGSYYEI